MGNTDKVRAQVEAITGGTGLRDWVSSQLGLKVPDTGVCPGHVGPLEYLKSAFFEPARDLIVWGPRGGGKTRLAAVATLLDLLHKPNCQIRILGGSLEQSLRMWDHLVPDVETFFGDDARLRSGKVTLLREPGGGASVLAQSQRSVRGVRLQKLRCDEVELFKPDIWEAAQLVTRSIPGVRGSIEAISTFHRPGGMMQRLTDDAAAGKSRARVLKWCILDILEHCPPQRVCATCPLEEDCGGKAKDVHVDGFFSIDDAIAMKQRVSKQTWESEMLCRRPSVRDCVFPEFSTTVHVSESVDGYAPVSEIWLAIDFGFAAPFVCLWVADGPDGITRVLDEYVQERVQLDKHVEQIESRRWPRGRKIACDPAGNARSDQTAQSNVDLLKARGYHVHTRRSLIVEGLERIRAALSPAAGPVRLFIHPRCKRLVTALQAYRYAPGHGEEPLKDGVHDHLIDALRYYFINHTRRGAKTRGY